MKHLFSIFIILAVVSCGKPGDSSEAEQSTNWENILPKPGGDNSQDAQAADSTDILLSNFRKM